MADDAILTVVPSTNWNRKTPGSAISNDLLTQMLEAAASGNAAAIAALASQLAAAASASAAAASESNAEDAASDALASEADAETAAIAAAASAEAAEISAAAALAASLNVGTERTDIVFVTDSVVASDTVEGEAVLGQQGTIMRVQATARCWIRFYGREEDLDADAGRTIDTDPSTPLQYEAILDTDTDVWSVWPTPYANQEAPTQNRIFYRITKLAGEATGAITVTVTRTN